MASSSNFLYERYDMSLYFWLYHFIYEC